MFITNTLAHFFLPRRSNNLKARILHPSYLVVVSILLFTLQIVLRVSHPASSSVLGYSANISISEVIRLTNEKRAEAGVPPVTFNQQLSDAALEKGHHMIDHDYWAHVAPDGTDPWHFFINHGYKYRYAGENLARDFSSPSSAVDAWMASPSHRENMLSNKYKEIGIGVVEGDLGGTDTTIIVQLFGTLLSDSGQNVPIAQARTENIPTKKPTPNPSQTISPTPSTEPSVTSVPMISPEVSPPKLVVNTESESKAVSGIQTFFSPFQTTRGISLGVLSLLILITVVDALFIAWKRIPRVSGRAFAHIAFFGMIIVVVLIIRAGKIL